MKNLKSFVGMSVATIVAAVSLTACSGVATPTGMCGWVVGDGKDGRDAKVSTTLYPDEKVTIGSGQIAQFVPCGPRNYIVNEGTVKDNEGNLIGDRHTPIVATTASNTPVNVQLDSFWVLNQQKDALSKFKELCNKYTCYTTEATAGSSNFASKGWNGMLAENMGPAIESATKAAMKTMPDEIWKQKDQKLADELADKLAASFKEEFSVRTGYNVDLLCGSGNSVWADPTNRENSTFECTNVRFKITDVSARDQGTQNNANAQSREELDKQANQSRFNTNQPLYGDQTNRWLGIQDSVKSCPQGSTCNFNLGESSTR